MRYHAQKSWYAISVSHIPLTASQHLFLFFNSSYSTERTENVSRNQRFGTKRTAGDLRIRNMVSHISSKSWGSLRAR